MKKNIRFIIFAVVAILFGSPSVHADIVKGRVLLHIFQITMRFPIFIFYMA